MEILYLKDEFSFHESTFISPNVSLAGKITLGENTSVWFQSVLRGDVDEIIFGKNCNIQDGSIIHCVTNFPVIAGDNVSLGHGVILHGCTLGDNILVGMRATILTGAKIGNNCLIAAGSLITEGTEIPPNSLVVGAPAKVKRELSTDHHEMIRYTFESYVNYTKKYKEKYGK